MSSPSPGGLTPAQFVAKWTAAQLSERAASQEHFLDLCHMLGQPTPAGHDATGAEYTFEKGVAVTAGASKSAQGERGFADVWWRGKFGWEYKRKGKHRTLDDAYRQLLQYREALDNPPLLVVCDIAHTEIHTNFTGTSKQVHTIELQDLAEPANLDLLRRVFTDPDSFKPHTTTAKITEDAAGDFGKLAQSLHDRGHDPHDAAHFLMRCMFCLFAEDVGLFGTDPDTGKPIELFRRLLTRCKDDPDTLPARLSELFDKMATGGDFGLFEIPWFNGGLFNDSVALPLTGPEIGVLLIAAAKDWASVEPAIFGTLFERSLDPTKRAQIGAHYTSRDDIMLVIDPVILDPLRRQWADVQAEVDKQLERRRDATTKPTKTKADAAIADALQGFMQHLAEVRILDPACGSGNFLYVAIQQLLDLEKQVITYAARPDIGLGLLPTVRPTQLHGIEINPYAAELAQVVIWIGYLQWMRDNGFNVPRDPILEDLKTIENRDAILDLTDPDNPKPATWPPADYIIGNPPFLGSKVFRQQGMDDEYLDALYATYELPNTSDLCCYWFELAHAAIATAAQYGEGGLGDNLLGHEPLGGCPANVRVGLLATQGIRGGSNRTVLQRIKQDGDIFAAWSDRTWILDGAMVHVSIVCFDGGGDANHNLNGRKVDHINANLTANLDMTQAKKLPKKNSLLWSVGTQKGGSFDLDWVKGKTLLSEPGPAGVTMLDVIRPWISGIDTTARNRGKWIIYFPPDGSEATAAIYESPFEYVKQSVKPFRDKVRRATYRERWWIHQEPRSGIDEKLRSVSRFLVTPMVTKHRLFAWANAPTVPDKQVTIFITDEDYVLGALHAAPHELWARAMGTQLREAESGFRYTPTTCFETFPMPWMPGRELADHPAYVRISVAAQELNEQRERWLNPPEWIDPIAKQIDAEDDFTDVPEDARPLIRQSAIMARAAKDARLKKRTLTNLYNQRPTWLKLAHEKLDRAVLAAYAATDPAGDWSEDWAEVWKETGAGQPLPEDDPLAAKRAEVDQAVLANLLRLNQSRAAGEGE